MADTECAGEVRYHNAWQRPERIVHQAIGGREKLTLNYNTFISQYQSIINQTDISINITRSLTRLKSVCVSLWKDYAAAPSIPIVSSESWNYLCSPVSIETINGVNTCNLNGEFQCQLQVGSKLCPEYPMRNHQEAFLPITKKTLRHQSPSIHSFIQKRMNIQQFLL